MRHHVTEEARHLSFARHYLKRAVPELSWARRQVLAVAPPIVLGTMAQMMVRPPASLVQRFDVPADVVRAAYRDPRARDELAASVRKVRRLAREIGIVPRVAQPLWRAFGLWDDDPATTG